jgi:multicomponent Na+:H+ antiporter subunit F
MFNMILYAAMFIFSISIAIFMYRVIKGPSVPDRIMAMDTIGINLLAIMAILSIVLKTRAFFDVILLFGILSFVGTIAFSKFIERGVLVEHDRNG